MNIIEDIKYLIKPEDIEDYFKDCGHEYFACGQGYFQEEVNEVVKINEDYFSVTIKAEIEGTKQDRGDRLYFVESITSVTHKPISYDAIKEATNKEIHAAIVLYKQKIIELKAKLL